MLNFVCITGQTDLISLKGCYKLQLEPKGVVGFLRLFFYLLYPRSGSWKFNFRS